MIRVRRLVAVVVISLVAGCLIHDAAAKNRFNVFTYHEPNALVMSINNWDYFYASLDTFGVSLFYTNFPDSAAKYGSMLGLQYDLTTGYVRDNLTIDESNVLQMWRLQYAYYLSMSGIHDNARRGYRRNEDDMGLIIKVRTLVTR